MNSTSSVDIGGYSALKNQSVCDENIFPVKITNSSSLMPLKCLPRGIGYAEAMNAGKSRSEPFNQLFNAYLPFLLLMVHFAQNT